MDTDLKANTYKFNEDTWLSRQKCQQCGRPLYAEAFLGPVCGKCCKANHKKVVRR
uniref:Uncharacterized protein n=1 Tax=viral metagenome TaxID=1070528 RepID=A0A6M3LNX4_9ZZZZ